MRPMRFYLLPLLLLVAPGCNSCGANQATATDAAPSATPSGASSTTLTPPRRHSRSSNPASAFVDAATTLDIDAATRAKIEHLDDGLDVDDTKAAVIFKAYRIELAKGVRANKIEPPKLETYYADIAAHAKAREEKAAVVFNNLHAALTPDQRVKVATKMKADQALREARAARGRKQPSAQRRILMGMVRNLELEAKQLREVDALIPPESPDAGASDPKRAHFREVADAFGTATFDAKQHLFDEKEARSALEDQTKLVTQLLPILTEKQRDKLASVLDETVKQTDGVDEH